MAVLTSPRAAHHAALVYVVERAALCSSLWEKGERAAVLAFFKPKPAKVTAFAAQLLATIAATTAASFRTEAERTEFSKALVRQAAES